MATFVGSGVDLGDGVVTWSNPGNVTAKDGAFASVGLTGGNSNTLRCTMGANAFTSAADAVGILVQIDAVQPAGGTATFALVRLVQGGTEIGTNQSGTTAVPTTLTLVNFGGSTSTMGYAGNIPQAVVNSSTFGVDIQVAGVAADTVYIDDVQITKYDAAGGSSTMSVGLMSGGFMTPVFGVGLHT